MLLFKITGTLRGTFTQRSTQTSEMQHLIISINTIFLLAIFRSFSQNKFLAYPLQWGLVPVFQVSHFEKKTKTKVITQCNIFQENKYYMYCDVGTLIHSIRGALDASDKFKSSAMLKDSLST